MSLTKPIPQVLKDELSQDEFYKKCCIADNFCLGVIQWHHNLESYVDGNKGRVNEKFCILPICKAHHDKADTSMVREKLNWIMWNRATETQIQKYSKAINYTNERKRLNNIYGNYTPWRA